MDYSTDAYEWNGRPARSRFKGGQDAHPTRTVFNAVANSYKPY
ncbi:hypothetical protein [Scytonema sp. HK-05]|nr:hypothetical protein [Scytonema sp. HK-05]